MGNRNENGARLHRLPVIPLPLIGHEPIVPVLAGKPVDATGGVAILEEEMIFSVRERRLARCLASGALTEVVRNHYIKLREKPNQGGLPDVAISPYVVSFVHRHFGYCDLLGRSVINDVAGEASSVSLATGRRLHVQF